MFNAANGKVPQIFTIQKKENSINSMTRKLLRHPRISSNLMEKKKKQFNLKNWPNKRVQLPMMMSFTAENQSHQLSYHQ